jgi:protein-S-isoprenylcysteine O-methyltransferase Ste14
VTPLYREGVGQALFSMVAVVWLVSEFTIGVRSFQRVGDRRQDRLSGPALVVGMVLAVYFSIGVALVRPGAAISAARPVIFVLGLLVALAGIALRQYAVATLGRYFSTRVLVTPDQQVVDAGLYRYVRHPSYSGLLLTVLGMIICSTNWLSLACYAVAIPGFAYRIQVEEEALVRGLGEPYRAYMLRTKRLIPFVV